MRFDKFFFLTWCKRFFNKIVFNEQVLNFYKLYAKGFIVKPVLNRLYNRWLNLYNIFLGRVMNFHKTSVFLLFPITKNIKIKMSNKILSRYLNNFLFSHAFTRASHFLAVANMRYSYNKLNF